jgi:hypothetical protein
MIYNSNLVPQKYRFMAPIHPKMVEYEPWNGWYKQVSGKHRGHTKRDKKKKPLIKLFSL